MGVNNVGINGSTAASNLQVNRTSTDAIPNASNAEGNATTNLLREPALPRDLAVPGGPPIDARIASSYTRVKQRAAERAVEEQADAVRAAALRADDSLTPEQKKAGEIALAMSADRRHFAGQVDAIGYNTLLAVREITTSTGGLVSQVHMGDGAWNLMS